DDMIPIEEKKAFLETLPRVSLHVVTKDTVDGVVFHSAGHSLGADLLKVFERAIEELDKVGKEQEEAAGIMIEEQDLAEGVERAAKEHKPLFRNYAFQTERYDYEVDWSSGIPLLFCKER
ncbi:MAG: hypothetical protein K2K70_08395, partial [Lachnospiraceae bacterium]|nr:hypothetical protein [Lachnospiraceae bacterium]